MAAIPYAAFSAPKLHEQMKRQHEKQKTDYPGEHVFEGGNAQLPPSQNSFDMTPPKYNGKLMNSIWGLYNRYAPHAFQKNSEGALVGAADLAAPQTKALSLWHWGRLN